MAFTEPLDAAVVVVAQSAEAKLPKRASLPSSEPTCSMGSPASAGFGCSSAQAHTPRPMTNSSSMLARIARLWRRSRT